jgi:hypothetical protein
MTRDWVADTARVLDWLQEIADRSTGDARVFVYARDAIRLVEWLRTQPPRRVRRVAVLGSGTVLGLVLASRYRRPASPEAFHMTTRDAWTGM